MVSPFWGGDFVISLYLLSAFVFFASWICGFRYISNFAIISPFRGVNFLICFGREAYSYDFLAGLARQICAHFLPSLCSCCSFSLPGCIWRARCNGFLWADMQTRAALQWSCPHRSPILGSYTLHPGLPVKVRTLDGWCNLQDWVRTVRRRGDTLSSTLHALIFFLKKNWTGFMASAVYRTKWGNQNFPLKIPKSSQRRIPEILTKKLKWY